MHLLGLNLWLLDPIIEEYTETVEMSEGRSIHLHKYFYPANTQ